MQKKNLIRKFIQDPCLESLHPLCTIVISIEYLAKFVNRTLNLDKEASC